MKVRSLLCRGFSLVEMAIVLVILGLLLSGGLSVLSTQLEQQKIQETQKNLNEAREALLGFAVAQPTPRLPCPDKVLAAGAGIAPNQPNDGQEDRTVAGGCVVADGNLPWVTLGTLPTDPWGNRLRYSVTPALTQQAPAAPMTLATNGNRTINDAAGTLQANQVAAVILSHGRNGFGARNSNGGANVAPTGANELENTDGDLIFVSNPPVGTGGAGGEFDDVVIWLSTAILRSRLVQAARLP